jgi:hypothetical protein
MRVCGWGLRMGFADGFADGDCGYNVEFFIVIYCY